MIRVEVKIIIIMCWFSLVGVVNHKSKYGKKMTNCLRY